MLITLFEDLSFIDPRPCPKGLILGSHYDTQVKAGTVARLVCKDDPSQSKYLQILGSPETPAVLRLKGPENLYGLLSLTLQEKDWVLKILLKGVETVVILPEFDPGWSATVEEEGPSVWERLNSELGPL